jgi:hypothetical protein
MMAWLGGLVALEFLLPLKKGTRTVHYNKKPICPGAKLATLTARL